MRPWGVPHDETETTTSTSSNSCCPTINPVKETMGLVLVANADPGMIHVYPSYVIVHFHA